MAGKSYFVGYFGEILARRSNMRRVQTNYVYTYEWQNCVWYQRCILFHIQPTRMERPYEHPFYVPLNESPLNLIPYDYVTLITTTGLRPCDEANKVQAYPRRYIAHTVELEPSCKKIQVNHQLVTNSDTRSGPRWHPMFVSRMVIGANLVPWPSLMLNPRCRFPGPF
jgi:hypothetical protein